jgi:hypothetical protein
MRRALFAAASLCMLSAGPAMAGLVVTATDTDLSDNKPETSTVYIDNDRMKVVEPDNVMILRGDLKRMWAIKPADRSYNELTPQSFQQMKSQMDAAMAQMQARLAQLPPEQRARIEAMMAGRGMPGAPQQDKVDYVKAGGGKTVGSWHCDMYSKLVNGKKDEDVCIAPIASVGLTPGDFKVLDTFADMMGPLAQQNRDRSDYLGLAAMDKAIGFEGVPLESVDYINGKPDHRHSVNKIERTALPASTFDLPPGLTKKEENFGGPPH